MNFVGQKSSDFPVTEIGIESPVLRGREQEQRHDDVAGFLSQFSINQIPDKNGRVWDVLSRPSGEDTSADASGLWNFEIVTRGGRYQGVRITNPGTIRLTSKIDDLAEIQDIGTTIAPRENEWIYLEVNTDLTITLKAGDWENYPEMWEWEEFGATGYLRMVKHFYPLWRFESPIVINPRSSESDIQKKSDQVSVKNGVAARKFGYHNLQIHNVLVESETGKMSNAVQLFEGYKGIEPEE